MARIRCYARPVRIAAEMLPEGLDPKRAFSPVQSPSSAPLGHRLPYREKEAKSFSIAEEQLEDGFGLLARRTGGLFFGLGGTLLAFCARFVALVEGLPLAVFADPAFG